MSVSPAIPDEPLPDVAARIVHEWRDTLRYIPDHGWHVLDDVSGEWMRRDSRDVALAIAVQERDGGDPDLARRLAEMPERATRSERRATRTALRAWARKSPAMQRVAAALELAAPMMAEPRA